MLVATPPAEAVPVFCFCVAGARDMDEEWRPVVGYEGYYEVSSQGRVRGLERIVPRYPNTTVWRPAGPVSPQKGPYAYLRVSLNRNGKKKYINVHTIVCAAFLGARPKGYECRHIDGNAKNNRISNLCYSTHKENIADKASHGTLARGETHGVARLTGADVRRILDLYPSMYQREIAALLGVGKTTIGRVLRGQTWSHLTGVRPK
jgi:hypothetical protein